jgi:hypothetical protein
MEQVDLFTYGHVVFEMQSTYSLQEPFIREITDCPVALSESSQWQASHELLITAFHFRIPFGDDDIKRVGEVKFCNNGASAIASIFY